MAVPNYCYRSASTTTAHVPNSRREKSVKTIELHTDTRTQYFLILCTYIYIYIYKPFLFYFYLRISWWWLSEFLLPILACYYLLRPTTGVLYILCRCRAYTRVCTAGRISSRLVEIDRATTMFWTFRRRGPWGWSGGAAVVALHRVGCLRGVYNVHSYILYNI